MIVGAAIASVTLLVMSLASSLAVFSLAFFVMSIAMPMIMAPYSALIPDVVPEEQRGVTSGWLGAFSTLGFFCGGLITYRIDVLGVFGCYFCIILLHGACVAFTCYFVVEEPLLEAPPAQSTMEFLRGFMKPFRSMDFRWLFFTRFMTQMGTVTVQEYLQYYVKDAIQVFEVNGVKVADSAERAVSLLFLPLLVGAFISSICAGVVSDYYGGRRKFLVYISGTLMSTSALAFAITRSFEFDIVLAFVFGLGWGCFSAIDWAMATDVLPDADEFAKDMGVWSVAFVLPQVLAAPIAGNLLDFFEKVGPVIHLGYTIVFSLSALYFVAGTYFIQYIVAVK
jgi:MFS family permease